MLHQQRLEFTRPYLLLGKDKNNIHTIQGVFTFVLTLSDGKGLKK